MSKTWANEEVTKATEMLTSGFTYQEISKVLERTERAVKLKLNKLGMKSSLYALSPITSFSCQVCSTVISDYETSNRKFCSRSCSAKYNNALYVKRKSVKKEKSCLHCNKLFISNNKYCSKNCCYMHKASIKAETNTFKTQNSLRRYVLEVQGHKCAECLLSIWNGKPIPIELDHIDGNANNNSLDNLRLLCRNCHAQTPTYGAKNKGQGRFARMKRYYEGKAV